MKTSWRWFGSNDPVSLKMIRQTGVTDLVHALSVPAGEIWTKEELVNRNQEIEKNGLNWKVIESLPWSAEMLLGDSKRDQHLENYLVSLSNIQQSWKSKEPPVILYNLMLWADWYRTSFAKELENGKVVAEFVVDKMEELARPENIRAAIEAMANMRGWNSVYTVDVALELLGRCQTLTEAKLWDNVTYCLKEIIPTAQKLGLKLAVHPDDPPRSIFGIPRVMHLEEHFQKLVTSFPSDSNGICFCVGSLGANEKNDVPGMLKRLKNSVTNSHWRTVQCTDNKGSFYEDLHHLGSVKLSEIVKDFLELKIDCHFRADHAEWMWQNLETKVTPGYAGIGRFGATRYLEGLLERFIL